MAIRHLSELVVLNFLIANLPYAIGTSCIADNVLRAVRVKPTFVITETIYVTETFLSKTKTVKSPGTTTVIAGEVFSTITKYTTTFVPYLPAYVSQYPEARVSSACSCISQPVITLADYTEVFVSTTVPGTTTITQYSKTESTTISDFEFLPATTTHPAICYTSFLTLNFATANPQRPVTTITPSPGTPISNETCCTSCFHAKNCLYWSNDPSAGCKIVLGTTKVADLVLSICPLGIQNEGGLSKPGATTMAYNPGPCFKGDASYLFSSPFN